MKSLVGFSLFTLATLSAGAQEGTLAVSDLTFKFAAPWKAVESSSPMRAGTLQVAVEGAEKPLEAVFYYVGAGQGGDTDANVNRWFSQFEGQPEKSREEITVGEKKITLVKANGTYLDGPPMGAKTPKAGYALLGAIVPAGDANVFIKFTGPKEPILKLLEDFKKLASSPFNK